MPDGLIPWSMPDTSMSWLHKTDHTYHDYHKLPMLDSLETWWANAVHAWCSNAIVIHSNPWLLHQYNIWSSSCLMLESNPHPNLLMYDAMKQWLPKTGHTSWNTAMITPYNPCLMLWIIVWNFRVIIILKSHCVLHVQYFCHKDVSHIECGHIQIHQINYSR